MAIAQLLRALQEHFLLQKKKKKDPCTSEKTKAVSAICKLTVAFTDGEV